MTIFLPSFNSGVNSGAGIVAENITEYRTSSRELANSSAVWSAYLDLMASLMCGFKLKAEPQNADGSIDADMAKAIAKAWDSYASSRRADFTREGNLDDLIARIVRARAVDGEGFLQSIFLPGESPQFELVDAERIPSWQCTRENVLGLKLFPATGRIQAYYVADKLSFALSGRGLGSRNGDFREVPAAFMKRFWDPKYVDQYRGLPDCSSVIVELETLKDLMLTTLKAAQVGASRMGFIQDSGNSFGLSGAGFSGTPAEEIDQETGEIQDHVAGSGNEVVTFDSDTKNIDIAGLPSGKTFNPFNSQYPDQALASFVEIHIHQIAAALGISPLRLGAGYSGVSYSAGKLAEIRTMEKAIAWRNKLKAQIISPIYRDWLTFYFRQQGVDITGRFGVLSNHNFEWPPVPSIEPQKEAAKDKTYIELGVISRQQAQRDLGLDPEQMRAEIAEELAATPIPEGTTDVE